MSHEYYIYVSDDELRTIANLLLISGETVAEHSGMETAEFAQGMQERWFARADRVFGRSEWIDLSEGELDEELTEDDE